MRKTYNDEGILNTIYKNEQNAKIKKKLKNAKAIINMKCPETYNIFKKGNHKSFGKESSKKKIV